MTRLAAWRDTARTYARLRAEANRWRNAAIASQHAERELAEMNLALRRRCDLLEGQLAEERALHRTTVRVLRRYVALHGDLPAATVASVADGGVA